MALVFSQNKEQPKISKLFRTDDVLKLRLNYSNKDVKKKTNDSTYLKTELFYFSQKDNDWKSLTTRIRARGNFRLEHCYFAPLKMRIKKDERKGTVFKGNKKLKVVLPCMKEKEANDNIIKEYMAYQLYQHVSPYHFKTRLFEAELLEQKSGKEKAHQVKGFFIEDLDGVVERFECNEQKRTVHPLQQDGLCSTRNAFFQFMIGNTDFSTGYQHNEKLIFVNKTNVPVPYDFDMSGLVNASYSRVSVVGNDELPIEHVSERLYRGFKRDRIVFETVRKEFLDKKEEILATVDSLKPLFESKNSFEKAKLYLLDYFKILANDHKFNEQIVAVARTK
ncbi:hypothetical protein [Croceivirga thetidis]|nr:hypothetical protein [Croceivirga thetidis]